MGRFLKPTLRTRAHALQTYAHREPRPCDLSLISGPYIWQHEVERALAAVGEADLRGYASPPQDPRLLAALAAHEGLDPAALWLTPGADLAIEMVLDRFLEAGDLFVTVEPNFPRFGIVAAGIPGLRTQQVAGLDEVPDAAAMVAMCSPNNPSTAEFDHDALAAAIATHPRTLFCIDGVFDWYGRVPLARLCRDHDNVIVLKSLSKIGLAGLRLGYVMGAPELVADLQRGLAPFSVPRIVQAIGLEVAGRLHRVGEIRTELDAQYEEIRGAFGEHAVRDCPVPFYLLVTAVPSSEAAARLAAAGISVVDGVHFAGLPAGRLRIAIGSAQQNRDLIEAAKRHRIVN